MVPVLCQLAQWANARLLTSSLTTASFISFLMRDSSKRWARLIRLHQFDVDSVSLVICQNGLDFEHASHVWMRLCKANRSQLFRFFMQLVLLILCVHVYFGHPSDNAGLILVISGSGKWCSCRALAFSPQRRTSHLSGEINIPSPISLFYKVW